MTLSKARLNLFALLAATALLFLWAGQPAGAQKGGWGFQVSVELDGYWVSGEETVNIYSGQYGYQIMTDAWVQFTPPEWFVAADAAVPDGAHVGDIGTGSNLGLLNGPCNSWIDLNFRMLECTTNTGVTVSWNDGFGDANANGLPDACDKYPAFLNTIYPGITPRARYYGQGDVAGSPVSLNIVVFEPGTSLPGLPSFDPGLGYPSILVINDPTIAPMPGPITDICTEWRRNEHFWGRSNDNPDTVANESNFLLRRNPDGWGSYNFATFARPLPDADDDGIENRLDTCPFNPNWDENPRDGNGPDGDGLDSVCDPGPDVTNTDQDGDGYANRGDNCPLDPNGLGGGNQADADSDGIGDACDPNPFDVDGPQPDFWSDFWVEVSGDSDNDGWSDAFERLAGSDPNWERSTPEGLWRTPWTCSDSQDNDLDGLMDGYDLGCDRDNDRIANVFDSCVEDPEDWDGFEDSDGCPDNDNDMDGRWDWEEGCMDVNQDGWCDTDCRNLPEDYDSYQDWDGCPDVDNDGDSFPDVTDECPGTNWTAGPDGKADTGDEPLNEHGVPIQTKEDYDGIIDWDGCHDSPGDDYDADGFADEKEAYVGTDPADACPDWSGSSGRCPGSNCDGDDAWPFDINVDTRANILDVLLYKPVIMTNVPPSPARFDLNADNKINILDVLLYKPVIMTQCINP